MINNIFKGILFLSVFVLCVLGIVAYGGDNREFISAERLTIKNYYGDYFSIDKFQDGKVTCYRYTGHPDISCVK